MRLILPADAQANLAIGEWVAKKLNVTVYAPYYAVGIARSEAEPLRGGVVFNAYNRHQIELTAYGPGAFTPGVVRALANYVFNELGCERVSARTRRSNARTRKLLAKHFKFEGKLKRYFGKDDALLYCMFAEDCPWLEKNDGKHARAA